MNLQDIEKAIHCQSMTTLYPELKAVTAKEMLALLKLDGRCTHMSIKAIKLFAAGVVLGLRLNKGVK